MFILITNISILIVGFVAGFFVNRFIFVKKEYGGTIVVTKNEEKTIYSLELNDYPDSIDYMDEVLFKIEHPDESPNRD